MAKTSFVKYFQRVNGSFPSDLTDAVDHYLTSNGLWGTDSPGSSRGSGNGLKKYFASLVQNFKLKPHEIAEMTLTETLLYTVDLEGKNSKGMSISAAIEKAKLIKTLPVEHYLRLAQVRSAAD